MDEFAALAQRVVLTMDDVRGCLVLSRDGLVLGAFPEDQEAELKPAWLRFVHVGEARKGFVEFSDQLWAFVHRGPYAAFVVTGTSVRPGVMLDQLEQAVIAAEETRAKQKEVTLKVPDAAGAPSGRPRTSLHPPADRPAAAPVGATPAAEEMPSFAAPTGPVEGSGAIAPGLEQRGSRAAAADAGDAGADGRHAGAVAAAGAPAGRGRGAVAPVPPAPPPRSRADRVAAGRVTGVGPAAQRLPPARVPHRRRPDAAAGGGRAARPRHRAPSSAAPVPRSRDRSTSPCSPTSNRRRSGRKARRSRGSRPSRPQPPPSGRRPARAGVHEGSAGAARGRRRGRRHDGADADASAFRSEPQRLVSPSDGPPAADEPEEPGEVDRVMLAKEFSGLLQVDGDGDED